MGRALILTWIMIFCLSSISVHSQLYYSESSPYHPVPKKITKLHIFLHLIWGSTTVPVAQANLTSNGDDNNSSLPFGTVFVTDAPLRMGPEPNSKMIGNVQGITASTSKNGATAMEYVDFGFTEGYFNGSSFSVFSRNPITETERELAVVGGRGKFRMATGFARPKIYFSNQTILISEWNVTLIHY